MAKICHHLQPTIQGEIQKIIQKNWHLLLQDPKLGPILPQIPKVCFRKARNFKNILAPSKLKTGNIEKDTSLKFNNLKGVFGCKKPRCLTCQFIHYGQESFSDQSGQKYPISQFLTCSHDFVIYGLTCSCKKVYVGRTIRPVRKRIGEHRRLIEAGNTEHSVPKHFTYRHQKDITALRVFFDRTDSGIFNTI